MKTLLIVNPSPAKRSGKDFLKFYLYYPQPTPALYGRILLNIGSIYIDKKNSSWIQVMSKEQEDKLKKEDKYEKRYFKLSQTERIDHSLQQPYPIINVEEPLFNALLLQNQINKRSYEVLERSDEEARKLRKKIDEEAKNELMTLDALVKGIDPQNSAIIDEFSCTILLDSRRGVLNGIERLYP